MFMSNVDAARIASCTTMPGVVCRLPNASVQTSVHRPFNSFLFFSFFSFFSLFPIPRHSAVPTAAQQCRHLSDQSADIDPATMIETGTFSALQCCIFVVLIANLDLCRCLNAVISLSLSLSMACAVLCALCTLACASFSPSSLPPSPLLSLPPSVSVSVSCLLCLSLCARVCVRARARMCLRLPLSYLCTPSPLPRRAPFHPFF